MGETNESECAFVSHSNALEIDFVIKRCYRSGQKKGHTEAKGKNNFALVCGEWKCE